MKTNWLKIVIALLTIIVAFPLQAQKLIKKELKTENNRHDGFEYKWNMYTYVDGKDTLQAAFDLNNERITPNGYKVEKRDQGVYYVGGGMFSVDSNKKNSWGSVLVSGYNTAGKNVFPKTNYTCIFYIGDGLFILNSSNESTDWLAGLYDYQGKCIISEEKGYDFFYNDKTLNTGEESPIIIASIKDIDAAYDANGKCIIPESLGYNHIGVYYGAFWCDKEDSNRKNYVEHTITMDGKYYAVGHYSLKFGDKEEFEKNKKLVSNMNTSTKHTTLVSSDKTSVSSSSISKENRIDDGLLYEGDYTQGTLVAQGSGMTMPPAMINHHIKIYEDHIEDMGTWKYIGTSGGNRVYTSQQGWSPTVTVEYHVDNYFNITEYRPVPGMYGPVTYVSRFSKGNVSYDIHNQSQNQTYSKGSSENPRQIEYYEEDCYSCHGTGKCPSCNGTHRINYQFGSGTLECPNCKPNGACSTCNGSGKVKKMRVK